MMHAILNDRPGGLISLQFDDSFASDYTRAYRCLRDRGLPAAGTTAMITGKMGWPGKLTWDQAERMRSDGWDFQCHTHTHVNLQKIGHDELRRELEQVDQTFEARGWAKPTQHYTPFRSWTAEADPVLRAYRRYIMGEGPDPQVVPDFQRLGISHRCHRGDVQDQAHLDQIKAAIDQVRAGACDWLIVRGHAIEDEPAPYAYLTPLFEAMVDHAIERGLRFVSVEQGLRLCAHLVGLRGRR